MPNLCLWSAVDELWQGLLYGVYIAICFSFKNDHFNQSHLFEQAAGNSKDTSK